MDPYPHHAAKPPLPGSPRPDADPQHAGDPHHAAKPPLPGRPRPDADPQHAGDPQHAAEAPLPGDVQRTPLPERVIGYWRIRQALTAVPFTLAVLVAAAAIPGLPLVVRVLIAVLALALLTIDVRWAPPVRHRTWWYAIGEEQIDLQRGIITVERVVVPMTRVQHVELQQGPLARHYRLAGLQIHTAAGVVAIPALDADEGDRIRQRIADLARIADDL